MARATPRTDCVGPDASWILTAGGDHKGFVTFYDAGTGEKLHQDESSGHIHGFVLHRDEDALTAAGHEQITQWTLKSEAVVDS